VLLLSADFVLLWFVFTEIDSNLIVPNILESILVIFCPTLFNFSFDYLALNFL